MATMTGLFRLGRDPELRTSPNGTQVLTLSLAYNYGTKDQGGKRPVQWIDGALFGKRAESLAPYLQKGSQIYAVLNDLHVRTYQKKDGGEGFSLAGVVQDVEFASSVQANGSQARTVVSPSKPQAGGMDFDDDIPFSPVRDMW
jgi:single-strand DNA-binding protein